MPFEKSDVSGIKKSAKCSSVRAAAAVAVPSSLPAATNATAVAAATDPFPLQTDPHLSADAQWPADMTFEVSAREVIFHSFTPNSTYEAVLTFKNRTKLNQYLRVVRPESRCFSLTAPKGTDSTLKVASGLTVSYCLMFTPEENRDYTCALTVLTDHEQFTIPVRAFGSRGRLELPSRFTVNDAPVRGTSSSSLFLRNNGIEPCVWRVSMITDSDVATPFAFFPNFGTILPGGGVTPVEVVFAPRELGPHLGTVRFFLGPEGDMVQEMPIAGAAVELPVMLEVASVEFVDTFVTTERQAVVTVRNGSDCTVEFCWKSDHSEAAEAAYTNTNVAEALASLTLGSDRHMDWSRTAGSRLADAGRIADAVRSVQRVFDDDVFSIEPASGVLYGRATKKFTVTFSPQLAVRSTAVAFLDVAGRHQRMPLQLCGVGIGPQCKLEYTRLDIGDVYMNALHEYEVEIENVGSIEARFSVLPTDSILGQKFSFEPASGVLGPGEVQLLKVRLQSDIIGVIADIFHIHLHGAMQDLTLQFKGRIVGPTFQFDVDELDFGNVSYNFWHSRTFRITNTSQVLMGFALHLPPDCAHVEEFQITPAQGMIAPHGEQEVRVELLSNTVGEYETALVVDIDDVGENVDSIPVKAACMVPPLFASVDRLTYGRCFVGYDYTLNLEVVNETSMSGKFEVVMLGHEAISDQAVVRIGTADHKSSIEMLESHTRAQVPITLRALDIGNITFSLHLRTLGCSESRQTVLVTATGCGPIVEVQPTSVGFGQVNVLQAVEKAITLTNTSPIAAAYEVRFAKTSLGAAHPIFRVEPTRGVMDPYSNATLTVAACLDEAMAFGDDLVVDVKYSAGTVKSVPIHATGKGFALVPEIDVGDYDFGDVFTDTRIETTVIMHNKGRKDQEVQWQNLRGSKVKEGSQPLVFSFRPERILIPARGSVVFQLVGMANTVGVFSDEFSLKQTGTFKEIMRSKVSGNFIAPVIAYSNKQIQFEYIHADPSASVEDAAVTKSFTMKNVTSMSLDVVLKVRDSKSPFSLEGPSRFTLPTGETTVVGVRFDPSYRGDYVSHSVKNRVIVSFANHSHTEGVMVSANLLFPSVRVDPGPEVDFGIILDDTEERRQLVLVNESAEIPATFEWKLQDTTANALTCHETEENNTKRFDFVPFRGTIPPGGSQTVEAVFYGTSGRHEAAATCVIAGGPSFPIKLTGAAGEISVVYDCTSLDFGVMQYYSEQSRIITISNPSHVAVKFSVNTRLLKHPACIRVTPASGVLRDKQQLTVFFSPTIPDEISEVFSVQVGHFDPQLIRVMGRGQMNTIAVRGSEAGVVVTRTEPPSTATETQEQRRRFVAEQRPPYIHRTSTHSLPRGFNDAAALEAERLSFCAALLNENRLREAAAAREASVVTKSAGNSAKIASGILEHTVTATTVSVESTRRLDSGDAATPLLLPERRLMRRNSTTAGGASKCVLARYRVDFGHMTRKDSRTTKVRLLNTCPEPLFLMLDSKEIAKVPLTVTPLKIPKLGPMEETTLEITFDAANDTESLVRPGENMFEFGVDIKGGPVVVVECLCYVATPSLRVSNLEVEFGEVVLGQAKVVPVTVTNEQAVPCEWRITAKQPKQKRTLTSNLYGLVTSATSGNNGNGGDAVTATADIATEENGSPLGPQFWTNLDSGVLAPHESLSIEAYFAPLNRGDCATTLLLRFLNNTKVQELKCHGIGRALNVIINPSPVRFPVVRPFQVAHEVVKVTNHEDFPVELFCSNIDHVHAQECAILESALRLTSERRLILPTRGAGDFLPDDLLERLYTDVSVREAPLTYTPAPGETVLQAPAAETPAPTARSAPKQLPKQKSTKLDSSVVLSAVDAAAAAAAEASAEVAMSARVGKLPKPCVILLLGPPQSGKTTQARHLQEVLDYTLIDLDSLVAAEAERDTANGEVLRNILAATVERPAQSALPKGPRLLIPKEVTPLDDPMLNTLFSGTLTSVADGTDASNPFESTAKAAPPTTTSVTVAAPAFTPSPPAKSGATAAEVPSEQAATSGTGGSGAVDAATYTRFIPAILKKLLHVHMQACIAERQREQGTKAGFIMDDLTCALTTDKKILHIILKEVCAALSYPLKVVSLEVSEATVGLRYILGKRQEFEKSVNKAYVAPLTEVEYEALIPPERDEHNRRLKYYNDCCRVLNTMSQQKQQYEAVLQTEPQPVSVQEKLRQERQAAAEQEAAQQKVTRKANRARTVTNTTAGTAETLTPSPMWDQFSPLDAFKHLYTILAKAAEEEQQALPPAQQSQRPSAMLDLGAEQTAHDLTNVIVQVVASSNSNSGGGARDPNLTSPVVGDGTAASVDAHASLTTIPHGESSVSGRNLLTSPLSVREGGGASYGERFPRVREGVWFYVDMERLRHMRCAGLDHVRFFSMVEREVMVVAKKNSKARAPNCVRSFEEMSRWLLPPRSSANITVEFCCDRDGAFEAECEFGIVGTLQTVPLTVQAHTALPDMERDEKTIFPLTRPRQSAGKPLSKVFLLSKRLYEFGALLVPAPVVKRRKSDRSISSAVANESYVYGTSETLTFTNHGITLSEVSLTFQDEKDKTFSVTPTHFSLDVGATQEVTLRACPDTVGELVNRLIACVKDNPTPWFVDVKCIGSRPALTIDGRKELELDFGRSVLNRATEMTVMLANTSQMPVLWKLNGTEKIPAEVRVSDTTGIIEENGAAPLTVTFEPNHTCLHSISLQIVVSDPSLVGGAHETLPFNIKAEGHDVVLEWTREVDFKLMNVGETKREVFRVLNKSPYDVSYMIRLPRRLQNVISVSPQVGTIRGMLGFKDAAMAAIDVTARFEKEGEIPKKLGQLEVAFYHQEHNELLYPLQLIPVTGEAWYTRFSVKPSNIDFGSCFFNQRKEATFELHNTGRFPVHFQLFDYAEGCPSITGGSATGTNANANEDAGAAAAALPPPPQQLQQQQSGVKKGKGVKGEGDFRLGCYTVTPIRGTVGVGEVQVVTVVTVPEVQSRTRETLGIHVECSGPELESRGIPLEIMSRPATPGISADLTSASDVETIFEEQQVVLRLDQLDINAKAYGREDKTFSFGTALVGHRVEERFRIANSSPLPCSVSVQLQSANSTAATTGKGVSKPEGFELTGDMDPVTQTAHLVLPPFESRFVTVRFTPTSLQRFDSRFVATVDNGTDPRTNSLIFNLAGEGTLPNVEYVLPPRLFTSSAGRWGADGMTTPKGTKRNRDLKKGSLASSFGVAASEIENVVQLPLTRVGARSSRFFTIRNIGAVPADVRVVVTSDDAVGTSEVSVMKRNRDISIPIGSEEVFDIVYEPTEPGRVTMRVLVSLHDNPFENKELIVEARSFSQPVSFEGIDPASSDYFDIGDCYIGEPRQCTFQMRNNTTTTLRFAWTPPASSALVELVPSVGHIAPGATKPITATVTCAEVGLNKSLMCELAAQSIELLEYVDWDAGMMNQRWVTIEDEVSGGGISYGDSGRRNLRRVMEPVPEPAHRLTDDATVAQRLSIGYTCDRPTYKIQLLDADGKVQQPVEAISYPVTKIFQRRIVTLRLTNTGAVGLLYNFNIIPASVLARPEGQLIDRNKSQPTSVGDATTQQGEAVQEFSVSPPEGIVAPSQFQDIFVTFAPRTAEEVSARLLGHFPFHDSAKSLPLDVPLHGMGECPLVHFHIPSSNYLATRMDGEAGAVLDPETLVIELTTRGLHTRAAMRFKVVNPTATGYQFEWIEEGSGDNLSPFRCLTPSGTIAAGKQLEMAFEFSADTLGLREARWRFHIAGKASVPFLLVGKAVDPAVHFSSSKMHFGRVNIGNKVERTVTLENRDDVPFTFAFDKDEITGASSFLSVRPVSGTIGPKEKLPITITFGPQDEMEYNIPLVCQVKKASAPLTINVKGEGVSIHDALQVESVDDRPPVSVPRGQLFILNLGRVQVDEQVVQHFVLSNKGQYPLEYTLTAPERRFITIDETAGTVPPKQRSVVKFIYHPTVEESLRQFRLQFKIDGRLAYQVGVQAVTYIPKLHLNFEKYDFGPRFITSYSGGGEVTTTLMVTNNDKEMVTVDCSLPETNDWLVLDTSSFVARPETTTEVRLTFLPRETRMYDDKLTLILNGVYPLQVPISGEGVMPRVEVVNHFAKLGVAKVGERREVEMRLECRSRIPTPVSFVGCIDEDLTHKGISIASNLTMLLKPREVRTVTILFKPTVRMGGFQREMKMLVCGKEFPFALITGSCEDAEMHLDTTSLRFDDVVVGSSVSRRVVLMNSGDISQKFTWTSGLRAGGELAVVPQSGFIRSHTEFVCEIHFTPTSARSHIQRPVTVEFDNSPSQQVAVEATAIPRPPARGVLQFRCRARETAEQKVTIENSFAEAWVFEPTIDSEVFSAQKEIIIKPKAKADLSIVYAPLRSTSTNDVDEGVLFIPQPDGTALTYRLEGVAEAAGPSGALQEVTMQVQEPRTLKLIVENWFNTPLRFVKEVQWTPEPEDGVISVSGQGTVEVPPRGSREYAVTISSIRNGVYRGIVSFRCPERAEMHQYYEVALTVVNQPTAATVELHAMVRSGAAHNLPISNPLTKSVTVTCKLEGGADCVVAPGTLVVPPKSAVNLPIEFFPLVHRDYSPVKVLISSPELGSSTTLLKLISSAAPAEKTTRLVCPLGQSVTFTLRFTHFAKSNTEFAVRYADGSSNSKSAVITKVGQGSSVKAQASPWPKGQELVAEFTYEPQALGSCKETIELVSSVGGTYAFPLLATCTAPQRQGPYTMKPGQNTQIPFKNVFNEPIAITVTTDTPCFVVSKKAENVAAKKSISIAVQCKLEDAVDTARGKLIVSCALPGSSGETVEWVYYLECARYDSAPSVVRRSIVKKGKGE